MKSEKECNKIDFFGRKNDEIINNNKKLSGEDCQSKYYEKLIVYFSLCLFSFGDINRLLCKTVTFSRFYLFFKVLYG